MLFSFAVLFLFLGCKKDKNTPPPSPLINIEGFDLFDYSGNFVNHYGPADNDWRFTDSLSADEMKLFNFEKALIA